jgi:hypothetical protein
MSQMFEIVSNSRHTSTDVVTEAPSVETGYPRGATTLVRLLRTSTDEVAGGLPADVSTTDCIRHSVLPFFHNYDLMFSSCSNTVFNFRNTEITRMRVNLSPSCPPLPSYLIVDWYSHMR